MLKRVSSLIIGFVFCFGLFQSVQADYKERSDWLLDQYKTIGGTMKSAPADEQLVISVQLDMLNRQIDAADSFENLKTRVKAIPSGDPREDGADGALDTAEGSLDKFLALDPTKKTDAGQIVLAEGDPLTATVQFTSAEKAALTELSKVNRAMIAPIKPGNVPEGDVLDDFLPGIIRILMRFASLAVLISFLISGVLFVMAFGVEERITKAKHMLYFSLIGFAIVTLAFAIVKAVTQIDFFGFI